MKNSSSGATSVQSNVSNLRQTEAAQFWVPMYIYCWPPTSSALLLAIAPHISFGAHSTPILSHVYWEEVTGPQLQSWVLRGPLEMHLRMGPCLSSRMPVGAPRKGSTSSPGWGSKARKVCMCCSSTATMKREL